MFTQINLDKAFNTSRPIFNIFVYQTEDTLAQVQAAGYFSESRFAANGSNPDPDWNGAKLEVRTSDGYAEGFIDGGTGTFTAALSSL
jgi:hypothetical protein